MLRKKVFVVLLSFLIILIVGGGYGAFLLHNSKSFNSINGNYRWDNIRDNYVFNDSYDYEALPQKRYNIYFMAQSDFDPNPTSSTDGTYEYFYKSTITNNELDLRYGQFEDGSHYKVIRNVTEISMDDLHTAIGYPYTEVTDRANKPSTSHGWPLYFNGWALNYKIGNYDGLNLNSGYLRVTGSFPHDDKAVSFMRFGISIQRYIESLDNPYTNFSIYKRSENVDDIFLFPVYTSGKDYVTSIYEDRNDPIQIQYNSEDIIDSSNYKEAYLNEGKALNDSYDTFTETYDFTNNSLEDEKEDLQKNVKVYSKNAFSIDGFKHLTFKYDSGELGWNGWMDLQPSDGCSADLLIENEKTIENHPNGNGLSVDGVGKGVYTIYAFKKQGSTGNVFSSSEIKFFHDFLKTRQVTIFYSIVMNTISKTNYGKTYVNSFYLVFERFYEPRLVGGPTGSFDYNNENVKKHTFRRAVTNPNMFALENVEFTFSDKDTTSWHSENGIQFSNLFFNVSLNNPVKFFSKKNYGEEKAEEVFKDVGLVNYTMYNYTHYFSNINQAMTNTDFSYNDYLRRLDGSVIQDYNEILNQYSPTSHSYYSIQDAFVINPTKSNVSSDDPEKNMGYGIYSLALNIKYSDSFYQEIENTAGHHSFGPYYPSSVEIYAYRETNIFTVIYDNQSDYNLDLMEGENSRFIKPDLSGQSIHYAFIAKNVFLDTPVGLKDIFIATEKAPASVFEEGKEYTLEEIIKYYNDQGQDLVDSITEFVFNSENLENPGFKVLKNYVFIPKNK